MQAIKETLGQLQLGEAVSYENLAIIPLLGKAAANADYRLLDEALKDKQARVLEVSEGGDVPKLLFDNAGDQKVLLLDGDVLIGAKQNRTINLSILVPAHTRIEIPVSCVEAGRWSYSSREFSPSEHVMYRRARASKMEQVSACMKVSGDHYSDQSAVWDDIAERSNELNVNSRTASMLDAYDQYDEYLSAYRKAFKAAAGQVGAVFVVNGVVDGLECFDSPRAFEHTLEKLVGSYAMEAIMKRDKPSGQVAQEEVSAFIDALTGIEADRYPAIGEGEDLRFDQLGLTGGALQVEDRLVHLVAFAPQKRGPVRDRSRSYRNRPVH